MSDTASPTLTLTEGASPTEGANPTEGASPTEGANHITVVAMSLPLLILCLAALALPAALTYSLVQRGAAEDHPSWIVLGTATGALWLLGLALTLRSTRRPVRAE